MASLIYFTYGVTVLELPAPNYGSRLRPQRFIVRNAALGGSVEQLDMADGVRLREPRLTWIRPGLTVAKHAELDGFINTTVNLSELSFTFTDWNEDDWTVRYWAGIDDFEPSPVNRMVGTIVLKNVP